jgi:hypothetical protein
VRLILAAVALFGALLTPARPVVYVDSTLNSSWPVASAVWFVGQFTNSVAVFHPCVGAHRCIRIRQNSYIPALGETFAGSPVTTILVNGRVSTKWLFRRTLLAHELGHAHGIHIHNPYCTSVMYAPLACNNHIAPQTFTATERATLRSN